jgi:hypothetical protein
MFAPSVRKEYLKKAQQANALTQQAYKAYEDARKKYAMELGPYTAARVKYEQAMKAFGQDKYNKIAEGKLAPAGNDMAEITAILKLGSQVMLVGGEFPVEIDQVNKLANRYQQCVQEEKKAWDAMNKYLSDKSVMKAMGDADYKKWKKELRAELFKK